MYYKNRENIAGIDWSSTDNGGVFIEDVDQEILSNPGRYEIKNKKFVLLSKEEWFNDIKEQRRSEILRELEELDAKKTRPLSTIVDTLFDLVDNAKGDPSLLLSHINSVMKKYPEDVNELKGFEGRSKELRKELNEQY